MSVVQDLMNHARSDTDLLGSLDAQGDDFSRHRDVDFLLLAPSSEKAELLRDFINDHQYGVASLNDAKQPHGVQVVVSMPIEQNVICSVSGFMACLAKLFACEYDGWGCLVQKRT